MQLTDKQKEGLSIILLAVTFPPSFHIISGLLLSHIIRNPDMTNKQALHSGLHAIIKLDGSVGASRSVRFLVRNFAIYTAPIIALICIQLLPIPDPILSILALTFALLSCFVIFVRPLTQVKLIRLLYDAYLTQGQPCLSYTDPKFFQPIAEYEKKSKQIKNPKCTGCESSNIIQDPKKLQHYFKLCKACGHRFSTVDPLTK